MEKVLKCHVVEKIKKLFNEWEPLKKNRIDKKKQSAALFQKKESWKNDLDFYLTFYMQMPLT